MGPPSYEDDHQQVRVAVVHVWCVLHHIQRFPIIFKEQFMPRLHHDDEGYNNHHHQNNENNNYNTIYYLLVFTCTLLVAR